MTIDIVLIDSLSLDPANVRRHPTRNIDAIRGSLARFGQQRPIIVDPQNVVVAGNGTLQAARDLGWESIQIIRTDLSGAAATAFAIADNRTSETSEWDQQALADTLAALRAEDDDLFTAAGFTLDELAAMQPEQQSANTPPEEFPTVDSDIAIEHECPRCKYQWSGSSAPQERE